MSSLASVPVLTLCSVDPATRGLAASSLVCDLPDGVVLRYDVLPGGDGLARTVYSTRGVLEDDTVGLGSHCITCSLIEEVTIALPLLAARPEVKSVILALPSTVVPAPVVRALEGIARTTTLVVAPVVSVLDGPRAVEDLLGDDLLVERGLGLGEDDLRSVGEVLAAQVEGATVILTRGSLSDRGDALLEHLAAPLVPREPLHAAPGHRLAAQRRPARVEESWPRHHQIPARAGVWSIDLESWRPVHPERLRARLGELGGGPVRGRGVFWVPTRPGLRCLWDGAGGQLSIGGTGSWTTPPRTHLVVTGVDADPGLLREAFDDVLLTDAELARGLASWAGRSDGLEPWLGRLEDAA